jgi:hypothetical protein
MFGSAALDVVFGLIFVYLVLSLICSALNETISSIFAWRADFLHEGISNLLNDPDVTGMAKAVYDHSLIKSVTRSKRRRFFRRESPRYPSYLPKDMFSLALLDQIGAVGKSGGELRQAIEAVPDDQVKRVLLAYYRGAAGDARRFRAGVESWFDQGMERVSGWYRRRVQVVLWMLALAVALTLNADSIRLASTLWNDDAVREAVVARADRTSGGTVEQLADRVGNVDALEIPLGWTLEPGDPRDIPRDVGDVLSKLLGLFVTAIALTFGAPFWFDVLRKVAQVRSAGVRPRRDGSSEEPESPR